MLLESMDPRGVATLTLNRPERRNALDDALIASLTAALGRIEADMSVRVVVLAAVGASFCAGADLAWMRRMADYTPARNLADAEALASLMHRLDTLPRPTLARVQGPAYGGGVGLVCACDVAIGAETAAFRLSEVRLGLTPATIAPAVVRAIGARQARRYFVSGEAIPAPRAREIGLLHEAVPAAQLDEAVEAILADLLDGAPQAQAEAKDLVGLCGRETETAALRDETARRIARRRASDEAREGMAAFFERRRPLWAER